MKGTAFMTKENNLWERKNIPTFRVKIGLKAAIKESVTAHTPLFKNFNPKITSSLIYQVILYRYNR